MTSLLIKRYPNRKLYDTTGKRYISLREVAEKVRFGDEIQVTDVESGSDITFRILSQILLEDGSKSETHLPLEFLLGLVKSRGDLSIFIPNFLGAIGLPGRADYIALEEKITGLEFQIDALISSSRDGNQD